MASNKDSVLDTILKCVTTKSLNTHSNSEVKRVFGDVIFFFFFFFSKEEPKEQKGWAPYSKLYSYSGAEPEFGPV